MSFLTRHFGLLASFVLLLTACSPPTPPTALITLTGETMGTTYSIKLTRLPGGITAQSLNSEIDELLEAINDQMSTYRETSELSRFNQSQSDDWFPVSPDTATVVREALTISGQTDGNFDPTVAPLVNLWNFGPGRSLSSQLPSGEEIEAILKRTGFELVEARADPPALRKRNPAVWLDLSAIAKGFAVDQVAELLGQHGVESYMIEIGGEVRASGSKPSGDVWTIGIEAPSPGQRQLWLALRLRDNSLATSGDYRNAYEINGKRYSHTIDPGTGRPVEHQLGSVSVVHPSCMRADALATALMVMGPDEGYKYAASEQLAVLFITREGNSFRQIATEQFKQMSPGEFE